MPGSHHSVWIRAAAGELVSVASGRELWGREQAVQRPIASMTKMMTALVVLRAGRLGRRITITQAEVNYVRQNGLSNAGLHAGDILTARALLYAMLLPSGADAAMALAISYGPGIPAFIAKMNALARELHLNSTSFADFDGLSQSDLSTPTNLVKLGETAMLVVLGPGLVASPPLPLAQHEPAAQALPGRDRDQDRLDPGGR